LTISDSVLNGAKYDAQSLLIALRLSDLFLIKEVCEVSLLAMIVNVVLDDPLTNQVWCPVDVILQQFDFVQGEVRVNVTTNVVHV